ncbi:hypothetical protein BDV23DRAFT_95991 [Aspergillus alliaceus]|uniref:Uncharacterized protein n=1 Tax=Petromyces alliaceus TaxID=209559 RepID=A0A5N7CMV5_PETAA|nr:hypothetical protein BDV23DRAFT_95991 [Aspergillus alliaceus]
MSDDDPVVPSQPGETMEVKHIAAYADILKRYSRYLREDCVVLSLMAKVWAAERLAGIENQLSVLNPNRLEVRGLPIPLYVLTLQTIRIRCPKYQSHPWEVIHEIHLADVVREAVPLEDRLMFQEWAQADLAVEPSGISRVRRSMQAGGDCRMRKFNRYNHVLRRYKEACALRQIDRL